MAGSITKEIACATKIRQKSRSRQAWNPVMVAALPRKLGGKNVIPLDADRNAVIAKL